MRYIVKNCPCFVLGIAMKGNDKKVQTCNNYRIRELTHCSDIADCVIKQVIEVCKERSGKCERCKASEDYQPTDCLDYCSIDDVIFAKQILQLFDIEEIKE